MADAGAIQVRLEAVTKAFNDGIDGALGKMNKFASEAAGVAVGASVMSAGLIMVGKSAVAAFGDFDQALAKTKAVTGATSFEFEEMKKSALDLASASKFTAKDVAEGMSFMGMAGMKTGSILKSMPSVIDLAAAGMIGLSNAADITTNILSGMGVPLEDLPKSVDALVVATTSANVDLAMLGQSFAYVGPVATAAGLEFENVTAAIALMGNSGIQGSMAGTALRGILLSLMNPVGEAATTIEKLGIHAKGAGGKMASMTEIIRQLEESGASAAEIMLIFGDRAGPAMADLVKQGSAAVQELTDKLKNSAGAAARIATEMMAAYSGQVAIMQSKVERARIELGSKLAPTMIALMNIVGGLADWFSGLNEGVQNTIAKSGVLAAGLGLGTAALVAMAAILPSVVTGFRLMGTTALSVAPKIVAALWPVVAVIGAIVAGFIIGAAAAAGLSRAIDAIKGKDARAGNVALDVGDMISKISGGLGDMFSGLSKKTGDTAAAQSELSKAFADAEKKTSASTASIKNLGETAAKIADGFDFTGQSSDLGDMSVIAGGGVSLGSGFASAAKSYELAAKAEIAKAGIEEANERLLSQAKESAKVTGDVLKQIGGMFTQQLGPIASDMMSAAVAGFEAGGPWGAVIGALVSLASKAPAVEKASRELEEALGAVVMAFQPLLEAIEPITDLANEILVLFGGVLGKFLGAIGWVITKIIGLVEWVFRGIGDAYNGMIQMIADFVRKFNKDWAKKIESAKIGRAGESGGIETESENAAGAISMLGEAAKAAADAILNAPAGFKSAFDVLTATSVGSPAMAGGGTMSRIEVGQIVVQANDPEELATQLRNIRRWQSFTETGNPTAGETSATGRGVR